MSDCTDDCDLAALCSQRHWSIYWIVILCSTIFVFGRIATLGIGGGEKTPFMSANDRSRWATVQSLGEFGSYEIDKVIAEGSPGFYRDTIDKVQHEGTDGRLHFYSSKPTLFPTILSYVYRCTKILTSQDLSNNPLFTVRLILLLVNGIMWVVFLWLLGRTLELVQLRDWTRYFVVAAAGFATFLSTFAVTLNNHLPAAVCVMATVFCLVRIVNRKDNSWTTFAVAGLTAAFAAANELPALLFLVVASLTCIYSSPARFVAAFLPAAALVIAGFFWTNYEAHNDWRPPYAHRSDGELIETVTGDFSGQLNSEKLPVQIKDILARHGLDEIRSVAPVNWPSGNKNDSMHWIVSDFDGNRVTVVSPGNETFRIHAWDNWYHYEGSYWSSDAAGQSLVRSEIDRGQSDRAIYLFHLLFGHHGIFSLTPIWLLSLAGTIAMLISKQFSLRWLAATTILITVVVIGFYVFGVDEINRNYGGKTSAFRWAFWLAPMWLVCMAPVVDWLGKRTSGRALCLVLLGISAASALYSSENPWVHPWLYEVWESTGLPK